MIVHGMDFVLLDDDRCGLKAESGSTVRGSRSKTKYSTKSYLDSKTGKRYWRVYGKKGKVTGKKYLDAKEMKAYRDRQKKLKATRRKNKAAATRAANARKAARKTTPRKRAKKAGRKRGR